MPHYRIVIEQYARDPFGLRKDMEDALPEVIEADDADAAQAHADELLADWQRSLTEAAGGREPTGLNGLSIAAIDMEPNQQEQV